MSHIPHTQFHVTIHWPEMIRRYGNPSNFDAETYEMAHKVFVKRWVGRLARESELSLLQRDAVSTAHVSQTPPTFPIRARSTLLFGLKGSSKLHEVAHKWSVLLHVPGAYEDTDVSVIPEFSISLFGLAK